MSSFSDNFHGSPELFLGPGFAATFVQAIETGILINQLISFASYARDEGRVVKLLVLFVTAVALFQTLVSFYSAWEIFIVHFGDWAAVMDPPWSDKVATTVNMLMAAPVQSFLIWRCWMLTRNTSFIMLPVALLSASIAMSVAVTTAVFKVNFSAPFQPGAPPPPKIPIDPIYVSCISLSALLDIVISGTLLVWITRSRSDASTKRFQKIVKRVTVLIWEAAVPPCLCALMIVITYLAFRDLNFWDLFFQAILGKLYVISLFVTLNGRADIRLRQRGISPSTALAEMSGSWGVHEVTTSTSRNTNGRGAIDALFSNGTVSYHGMEIASGEEGNVLPLHRRSRPHHPTEALSPPPPTNPSRVCTCQQIPRPTDNKGYKGDKSTDPIHDEGDGDTASMTMGGSSTRSRKHPPSAVPSVADVFRPPS